MQERGALGFEGFQLRAEFVFVPSHDGSDPQSSLAAAGIDICGVDASADMVAALGGVLAAPAALGRRAPGPSAQKART